MTTRRPRGRPRHDDILTPAEWRIADAVRHGLTSRQIADRRGISIDAVKYHVANILAKTGLKDRRALRLWDGVAAHSALGKGRNAMDDNGKLGALGQVSRHVRDIEAARAWYEEALGLAHLYSFGTLAFFDMGGTRLLLSQAEGELPAESILYFRVGDIHSKQKELEGRGVAFTHAAHRIHTHEDGTEEWMAFFEDNDARPLALMAQRKP